jgi:hypothetical protein
MGTDRNTKALKKQFSSFLKSVKRSRSKFVYREIFEFLEKCESPAYLFGGAVRDIFLKGNNAKPNDFDIVFSESGIDKFLDNFRKHKVVKNNFGGYKVLYQGVTLDVWEIESTWAFKNNKVPYTNVSSILDTTFLNIESVLLELNPKSGKKRKVYYRDFFHSIETEELDINLPDNPFLDLSYSRIIHFSIMNKFSISPDLIQWMKYHKESVSINSVIKKYEAKYGLIGWEKKKISDFFYALNSEFNENSLNNFFLIKESAQHKLFEIGEL